MADYFNRIYDETYRDTLKYVVSKCRNLSHAEDITQNIYTTLFKIIIKNGNDYIDNENAFIINLAKRELYKYYLFKRKEKVIFNCNDEVIDSYIDEKQLSIGDQVFENIRIERIWEEIKKENIINQKIMFLYYLEDETIKEISILLNINESTVKSRIYRTLSRLKESFGENYE